MNKWGTVPIFAQRKWDCPLPNCDSCSFAAPKLSYRKGFRKLVGYQRLIDCLIIAGTQRAPEDSRGTLRPAYWQLSTVFPSQ